MMRFPAEEEMPMDAEGLPPDADMPDGDIEGMDEEGLDEAAMLDELAQAEAAGEQFAGESFFAPVPGAESPEGGGLKVEAEGEMTPEQLQELLAQLQQQA
jgi:hypothetical protein